MERRQIPMEFFEKVEAVVTSKGQEVVDKAKELAEIARLKSQIGTCEDVLKKNYMEIGRIYCENFGDCPDPLFEKQCRAVKNAKNGIEQLEKQIRDIKGI